MNRCHRCQDPILPTSAGEAHTAMDHTYLNIDVKYGLEKFFLSWQCNLTYAFTWDLNLMCCPGMTTWVQGHSSVRQLFKKRQLLPGIIGKGFENKVGSILMNLIIFIVAHTWNAACSLDHLSSERMLYIRGG